MALMLGFDFGPIGDKDGDFGEIALICLGLDFSFGEHSLVLSCYSG